MIRIAIPLLPIATVAGIVLALPTPAAGATLGLGDAARDFAILGGINPDADGSSVTMNIDSTRFTPDSNYGFAPPGQQDNLNDSGVSGGTNITDTMVLEDAAAAAREFYDEAVGLTPDEVLDAPGDGDDFVFDVLDHLVVAFNDEFKSDGSTFTFNGSGSAIVLLPAGDVQFQNTTIINPDVEIAWVILGDEEASDAQFQNGFVGSIFSKSRNIQLQDSLTGALYGGGNIDVADVDFEFSPFPASSAEIPLPAGFLLLISGLGGIGLLHRAARASGPAAAGRGARDTGRG